MWRRLLPQPRWLPRLAVMQPHRVVVACFALVLALTTIVGLRELYLVRERELRARQHSLELRALGVGAALDGERARLAYLSRYAERLYALQAGPDAVAPDTSMSLAFATRNSPVWQMKLPLDDASLTGVGAAQLDGLQGFERRDPDLMADLYVGRVLSQLLGLGMHADRIEGNALFISSNGFFVAYPPVDAAMAPRLMQRFATMPYYRNQTPEQNPGREFRWAPIYREIGGARKVTTLSVPVYSGTQFRGVIAIDVERRLLNELLHAGDEPGEIHYMVDRQGEVVASAGSDFGKILEWPGALPGHWGATTPADLFERDAGMLQQAGGYLLFHRAPQSPWLLVDVLTTRDLYAAVIARLSLPLLLIWIVLPLLLWVTLKVVTVLFDHYIALGARLQEMASHDPLTGLANRRQFRALCAREIERCRRDGQPIALLVVDIDFFKQVNDHWGHISGDRVLVALAQILRNAARASDLPARLGGEEFAVLLPQASLAEAVQSAERLRQMAAACETEADPDATVEPSDRVIRFTISIGVVEAGADIAASDPVTVEALVAIADRRLYDAKALGRNRVVSEDSARGGAVGTEAPAA